MDTFIWFGSLHILPKNVNYALLKFIHETISFSLESQAILLIITGHLVGKCLREDIFNCSEMLT